MFRSATIRLTGWYLLILMATSVLFSIGIYQIASGEIHTRLEKFQIHLEDDARSAIQFKGAAGLRINEENAAKANISIGLLYLNLVILCVGGLGSYLLAKKNIQPIEQAHEAQSRFTSDASHELRTPLAVMRTELEVAIKDKDATVNDLKETLKSNLEEVDKLSKLAEMLLSLSRSDHAKITTEPIDLHKVTINTLKDFGQTSSRVKVKSSGKLIVNGNETSISELVKVLVENALLYSPKNSVINISLSKRGQNARFKITNQGPGISADKLPYIFDRFYRADESRTNGNQKGHGLGLALAKKIVELHNGELSVSSAPDSDTTFVFKLPIKSIFKAKSKN